MAKKKLKKLLKGLGIGAALLGAGKALMNKKPTANVNSGRGGTSSSAIARQLANMEESTPVYQDDIMRGGSGVKNMRKIPGMIVEGDRYSILDSMGFKKGGKVRKTKKGGRAVRKASRSKKK
jgi:hypothetical protein